MIHYVATEHCTRPMRRYLRTWGSGLADRIRVTTYGSLFSRRRHPPGVYVFADLERLSPAERTVAAEVRDGLEEAGEGFRLLNDPERSMRRPELLRTLHREGVNDFRAVRADRADGGLRFPVFVRDAHRHSGTRTGLIGSPGELEETLSALRWSRDLAQLLVVEFVDTSGEDGLHRKYSAFRVGDRILPRHLIFGTGWMLKFPDLVEEEHRREEWAYLRENPHGERLERVFGTAGIEYGRVDYGLRDGDVQVWEINTNPIVMLEPEEYDPRHLPAQEHFADRIERAFRALDASVEGGSPAEVELSWRARLRAAVVRGRNRLRAAIRAGLGTRPGSALRPAAEWVRGHLDGRNW